MMKSARTAILSCIILQSSSLAFSNEISPSFDDLNFETEVAAAQAAANLYNPISINEDREFMGAIIRRGESFFFTVTAGNVGEDAVSIRVPKSI